jgi:Ca2+-binding EF-hand superfamily protein
MGAGSLTVQHENKTETFVDNMLNDQKQMDQIFKDISAKTEAKHPRNTISHAGLMKYYHECCHPFFLRFVQTEKILTVAHKYVCTKCNRGGSYKDLVSKTHFALFIDTIYLFSHLWTIFTGLEDDHKLDRQEFIAAKGKIFDKLGKAVHLNVQLSDEEWLQQFDKFDSNRDGHISFVELCTYVVDRIVNPEEFATFNHDDVKDENEEDIEGNPTNTPGSDWSMYSSGSTTVLQAERLVKEYKTRIKVIEEVLDHVSTDEMKHLLKEDTHVAIRKRVDSEMMRLKNSSKKR